MVSRERGPAIRVNEVTKRYLANTVFEKLSLDIEPGKLTLIKGPSGSGKTTLLNQMSSIDKPDEGEIYVDGENVTELSGSGLDDYRAKSGQIFQSAGLIPGLTARQNVESVRVLTGYPADPTVASKLFSTLGIAHLIDQPAAYLSVGEQQRVALVRALSHDPGLVFADEPTASLDTESKHLVFRALRSAADLGTTVVAVSHDEVARGYAQNLVEMRDGKIVSVKKADTAHYHKGIVA